MAISFDERVDYFVRRGKIHCPRALWSPLSRFPRLRPVMQQASCPTTILAHRSAPVAFHGLCAFKEKFDRQIFRK
jgi:hypothetical protein